MVIKVLTMGFNERANVEDEVFHLLTWFYLSYFLFLSLYSHSFYFTLSDYFLIIV